MRKPMKGQISYIMKPFTLIAVIVLLVFLLQSLYTNRGRERIAQKNLDMISAATNILLILSNSEDCVAYKSPNTQKTQANMLDVKRLDEFASKYQDREPECARNYDFGWQVKIEQLNKDKEVEREWVFGASGFSKGKSLENEVQFWVPVAIRYDSQNIKVGKMILRLVSGDLEKFAGFFDMACKMGQLNEKTGLEKKIRVSGPVTYSGKRICMGNECRELSCNLLYFDGIRSKGEYQMKVNFKSPDILVVGK